MTTRASLRVQSCSRLLGLVLLAASVFGTVTALRHPDTTAETFIIRFTSVAAFLLLHVILAIGPLARGEAWFAQRGWGALWLSRFVPGLRLPTLIAAGLLEANAGVFGAITATAGVIWVGAIIGGAALLSESQAMQLAKWLHDSWWIVLLVLGAVLLRPLLRRGHNAKAACIWCRVTAFTQRIWQWEFWPMWVFCVPVGFYYVWLGLRFRGFSPSSS